MEREACPAGTPRRTCLETGRGSEEQTARHAGRRGSALQERGGEQRVSTLKTPPERESTPNTTGKMSFSVDRTKPDQARLHGATALAPRSRPVCGFPPYPAGNVSPRPQNEDLETSNAAKHGSPPPRGGPNAESRPRPLTKPNISHLDRRVAASGAGYSAIEKGPPRVAARVHGGAARLERVIRHTPCDRVAKRSSKWENRRRTQKHAAEHESFDTARN